MSEVRHHAPEELAMSRVVDGLVESMLADSDGTPPEVELADVDRVQHVIPRLLALLEDVSVGDGIVVQGVLGHVILVVDDVLHTLVVRMFGIDGEKDILAAVGHLAEGGNHRGLVAIADVVLVAVGL